MGQRLPSLPTDWANLVAQGDSKRYEGAAAIRAQGTDAMTRGIQQGIAGITAGVLRKKEMAREDARTAKADARWERQFAQSTDELQFRKDTAAAHALKVELDEMDQKEMSAQDLTNPATGEVLVPGDASEMARVTQRRSELMQNLDVVTKRMIASPKAASVVRPDT